MGIPVAGDLGMKEIYCKVNEVPIPKPPLKGIELISQERERQLSQEGWSAQHDDKHPQGQLALVGACYALDFALYKETARELFPWDNKWWKPPKEATISESIHELAKAGALIAAEIDKLQRQWEFQKRTVKDKE